MPSKPLANPSYVIMEKVVDGIPYPRAIRPDWESAQEACKELAILFGKRIAGKVIDTECGVKFECAGVEYCAVEVFDVRV